MQTEIQIQRKKVFYSWLESHKKVNTAELEGNPERKGELEREFATMEVARCFLKDEKGEPYSFDFSIESIGVLRPGILWRGRLIFCRPS